MIDVFERLEVPTPAQSRDTILLQLLILAPLTNKQLPDNNRQLTVLKIQFPCHGFTASETESTSQSMCL